MRAKVPCFAVWARSDNASTEKRTTCVGVPRNGQAKSEIQLMNNGKHRKSARCVWLSESAGKAHENNMCSFALPELGPQKVSVSIVKIRRVLKVIKLSRTHRSQMCKATARYQPSAVFSDAGSRLGTNENRKWIESERERSGKQTKAIKVVPNSSRICGSCRARAKWVSAKQGLNKHRLPHVNWEYRF